MTLALPAFEGYPFPAEPACAPLPVPANGLRLWLDAGRSLTLDGATKRVAAWASRLGALSATQSTTAAMPVLTVGAINGRDAVVFDGADDTLRADALASLLSGTAAPLSWFTVERPTAIGGNRVALSLVGATAYCHAYNADANAVFSRSNDAGQAVGIVGAGAATPNATVVSYVYDGSGLSAWRDGALVATGGPLGGTLTATGFAIGAAANTSAFYAGAIGEVLAYSRALSSAERAGVEAYLKAKWGDAVAMEGLWYLSVFVPAAESAQADAVARAVWPDDPDGSSQLTVRLVDASGAAWRGGNAAVTDIEIAALQGLALLPSVVWFRYAPDGALGAAYPIGPATGSPWNWTRSLTAAGLTLVDDRAFAVGLS